MMSYRRSYKSLEHLTNLRNSGWLWKISQRREKKKRCESQMRKLLTPTCHLPHNREKTKLLSASHQLCLIHPINTAADVTSESFFTNQLTLYCLTAHSSALSQRMSPGNDLWSTLLSLWSRFRRPVNRDGFTGASRTSSLTAHYSRFIHILDLSFTLAPRQKASTSYLQM